MTVWSETHDIKYNSLPSNNFSDAILRLEADYTYTPV